MRVITILCLCSTTMTALSQDNKNQFAEQYLKQADTLSNKFKYDSAASFYYKAATIYEGDKNWLPCIKSYRLTSSMHINAAKYDTALYYAQKALNLANEFFNENNKDEMYEKTDVYLNMADVTEKKRDYSNELAYCQKAIELVSTPDSLDSLRIAQTWNKTGVAYTNLRNYDSAFIFCDSALNVRIKLLGEDHIDVAESNFNIGRIFSGMKDYDKALEYYQKALTINLVVLGEKHRDVADNYYNIANVYYNKGTYDKALEYYQKALTIILVTLGKQHMDVASYYNNIGLIYGIKGYFDQGLDCFQKALIIRISVLGEQHPEVASSYINIGNIYYLKGNYYIALEYFQRALEIRITTFGEQHLDVAQVYNNIGNVYNTLEENDKALGYFKKVLAVRVVALGEQHQDVARIYNNIGSVYRVKGQYELALEYMQKALTILITAIGNQHNDIANIYNNIGLVYNYQGEYEKALEYFQKALTINIAALGEQHTDVARDYNDIAMVLSNKGDYNHALEYLNKARAINIATLGEQHPYVAIDYNNLGEIYIVKSKISEALKYYQKALMANIVGFTDTLIFINPELEKTLSEPKLLKSLSGKANALYQLYKRTNSARDIEASLSTYALAFQLINSMRNGYNIEDTKMLLSEKTKYYYAEATNVAIEYEKIVPLNNYKAFKFIELGKSATLAAQFNEYQAKHFAGIPDSLIDLEKEYSINKNFYETVIAKEKYQKNGYDTLKVNLFENMHFQYSRKLDSLISTFETNYPAYYELKYADNDVSVSDIQSSLDDESAIIDYFVGDTLLFIAAITDSSYSIKEIGIDTSFNKLVIQYYKNLKTAETESFIAKSELIYQKLIQPIENIIADKKHLIILPDEYLYYLPFETLIDKADISSVQSTDYSGLNYLIKSHSISYHHSANLWYQSNQKSEQTSYSNNNFIGFAPVFGEEQNNSQILSSSITIIDTIGENLTYRSISADAKKFNPLPYTKDEVTSILQLFEKQQLEAKVYLYDAANETNFKTNAGQYKYVHIASHGFSNDTESKLSGIAFSQPTDTMNNAEDGIFFTGESYNLDLNADLVVLSSCESGMGKLVKGEGLQALSRGFLYVGTPNVMFSLWKTLDKPTKDLMVSFYTDMLDGASYAESLRKAKLKLIENPKTALPYFWSGYLLIGR